MLPRRIDQFEDSSIQNFIKIRLETYIYKILLQLHQNSKIKKLYKHFHSKT